ncbi:MAG: sigma factor [Chloroflexota bacterium]
MLVDVHLLRLDAAARLIVRDPELARDAVQEALIRAWRDLPGLRDPDGCTANLETIRRERHRFHFKLQPIVPPDPIVDVFCRPVQEGSTDGIQVTESLTYAEATGPVVLDGRSVTQTSASLRHLEATLGDPCVAGP